MEQWWNRRALGASAPMPCDYKSIRVPSNFRNALNQAG